MCKDISCKIYSFNSEEFTQITIRSIILIKKKESFYSRKILRPPDPYVDRTYRLRRKKEITTRNHTHPRILVDREILGTGRGILTKILRLGRPTLRLEEVHKVTTSWSPQFTSSIKF